MQRVSEARVAVDGKVLGEIGNGLLVFVGVGPGDDAATARRLADKVRRLRVFEDESGRMNQDLEKAGGGCLVVSQFTLFADVRSGNRPGFSGAAAPDLAQALYGEFVTHLRDAGVVTATGRFGADMRVTLINRGPVTLWLDSDALF